MGTILICTVGGSPDPIVKSIEALAPTHIDFICTDRDPVTGAAGSRRQIEGQGPVIRAHPADTSETLPNIPTQTGLAEDQYTTICVAADDLDATVTRVNERLTHLPIDPDTRVVADYTGGTKSMSAGLVLAALEHPGVELQVVTGSRPDLNQVKRGTERPFGAEVTRLRVERGVWRAVAAWQHFGYDAAADATTGLDVTADARLRALPTRAYDTSRALAAWDRFEHASALEQLNAYRSLLAPLGFAPYFDALESIVAGGAKGELSRLLDVWRSAERRAAQSRFDDAVARCYRAVEGAAQWLLWFRAGISSADVPGEAVPQGMDLRPDANGRRQAPLDNAWRIAASQLGGGAEAFYTRQREPLLELLRIRNYSILAHGWDPIEADNWRLWRDWMEQHLVPFLLVQARPYRIKALPPQLPTAYPASLLEIAENRSG